MSVDQFLLQVNDLNEGAVVKIRQQKHKEALVLLQKAEKMLEVPRHLKISLLQVVVERSIEI